MTEENQLVPVPAQSGSTAVRCYWCGQATEPWPQSGAHKHEWRWCVPCEAPRDQKGQAFEDD